MGQGRDKELLIPSAVLRGNGVGKDQATVWMGHPLATEMAERERIVSAESAQAAASVQERATCRTGRPAGPLH